MAEPTKDNTTAGPTYGTVVIIPGRILWKP